jgi:hypothetical protein
MEKRTKPDDRSPYSPKRGRPPQPAGTIRAAKAVCYLLTTEIPIIRAAARMRGYSVSDLLRAGLRSLGIEMIDEKYREPARD